MSSIRFRLSFAVAALALAACNGGANVNAVVTPSPSPVPTGTTTTITVRYQGNLQFSQPVGLYTNGGTATSPLKGTLITTKSTDPSSVPTGGQVTFTGLTPATIYCWVATVPASPPPQTATLTVCTNAWQNGFTLGS